MARSRRSGSATSAPHRALAPLLGSLAREGPSAEAPPSTSTSSPLAVVEPATSIFGPRDLGNRISAAGRTPSIIPDGAAHGPSIRFVAHQDPRSSRPSLEFSPVARTLSHDTDIIRVGRYSERDATVAPASSVNGAVPVGFKSKVVSRRHCEFWWKNGQWYIRDVKSSSGTFLNHIRLSQPSVESNAWAVNDGDIIQLGIDFKGGEEMIYRCVKIRVECNRGWQKSLNQFNTSTHQRLRKLAAGDGPVGQDSSSSHSSECSICLLAVSPCQALFVAPCSHVWHYKCIRPMLGSPKSPIFLCPNCRAISDLEAEIEEVVDVWEHDAQSHRPETQVPIQEATAQDENVQSITNGLQNVTATVNQARNSLAPHHTSEENHVSSSGSQPLAVTAPNGHSTSNGFTPEPASSNQTGSAGSSPPPPRFPTVSTSMNLQAGPGQLIHTNGQDTAQIAGLSNASELNGNEGPLTPRNDIGPFVLDGSAGHSSSQRPIEASPPQAPSVRSLDSQHETTQVGMGSLN